MIPLLAFAAGALTATVVVEVRDVLLTRQAVIDHANGVVWSTGDPWMAAEAPTTVAKPLWLVGGTDVAEKPGRAQGAL